MQAAQAHHAKSFNLLDRLEEVLISILIGVATSIIFVAVVHRYGTGFAADVARWAGANGMTGVQSAANAVFKWAVSFDLSWAQELCIYLFVWMAKFGAAYGVRTGIHVGVDVFLNMLGSNQRWRIIVFGLLAGAFFTGVVAALGANFVYHIYLTGQHSNDLEWPMWLIYMAIPLGSALMSFRFLQVAYIFGRTGQLPKHDEGAVEGLETDPSAPAPVDAAGIRPVELPSVDHNKRRGLSWAMLAAPLGLTAICLMQYFGYIELPPGLRAGMVFLLLISMMLTGMPISIALGLTVLIFVFTMTNVPAQSVALKLFTGIEKFEIMAIPFFILAGNFLTHGGVAKRMIRFATSMVGHWHGGLGIAGVVACALFAAVSGSSPATVVAIGSVILPAMVKQGFPARFGAGVITTSGALGILIPPSIAMVLYSVSTNTSVGALFMAGVIPGIMLASLLGLTTWYRARKFGYPRQPKASLGERFAAFRESAWGLFLIFIVIGGIYTGFFTPTEAAAVSAVYAFIIATFVYKDLTLRDLPRVLLSSAAMSAMLLYIITNAVLFSFVMSNENIPQQMAQWMIDQGFNWIVFLLVVNVLLLLAGNVMEPSSIILILAPILFPVAMKLGIDPIHFGILIVVNMEVGMCHPPVGLNLYVASGVTKMGITELTVAVWPWLLTMLAFLVVVTYIPIISTFLPRALGMM